MTKKSNRWIDEYEDDYQDKRTKKKHQERRKNKRLKNALRSNNIRDLQKMEEHDEYY